MTVNANVVDPHLAVQRAGGNRELAEELFSMLQVELPTRRDAMRSALGKRDLEALHHHAHKLHGSTLYCGVPALQEAITELSGALKHGDTRQLDRQVHAVLDEIDDLLGSAAPTF